MHRLNPVSRWAVAVWLALSLLAAPWATAFAGTHADQPPSAAHAMHADHAMGSHNVEAGSYAGTSCVQHEQCGGKCCTACAHCFTAAASVPTSSLTVVLAVYTPTVPRLRDRLLTAPHDRPPAV
jgi:hypothetical protein